MYCRKEDEILVNIDADHITKSKPPGEDEGGVSVGIGALDSPCLVSNDVYIKHCSLVEKKL